MARLTPELREQLAQHIVPNLSRAQLMKNFTQRTLVQDSLQAVESIYPNDHFSPQDIAFGLLSNGKFVSALDFVTEIEKGYISHSSLLVALGYAKNENDPRPKYDFVVRGIVKASLNHNVIFWETPAQLLGNPTLWAALKKCCGHLLKLGTVSRNTKVYGAGTYVAIGDVDNFI